MTWILLEVVMAGTRTHRAGTFDTEAIELFGCRYFNRNESH
ncbi:hypothetical protein HMPREF0762_01620 [Slackia exigua ATCC 700122]|uniref:Uncharacterized protein n=1 Tax=Slackia exigua (strain ATCC 700122 / DSM 15923 / CIP 105133 / JCM 11022 / KCTC 5966 / S-7) TaxID=649764 RepID=D0WIE6_SLAES|nr:hypothetical protein HMPREF0762_01620 [Slackia exigua ATCC 700122]